MDEQLIALKLCVDEIGGFSMSHFNGRLAYQKKVYLMQLFGVDLGYRFEWYLRGPYCTELTTAGFEIDMHGENVDNYAKDYELSREAKERLDRCKDMISRPIPEGLEQEEWLELLASMHYLARVAYANNMQEREYEQVSCRLRRVKPWYKIDQMDCAWKMLADYKLI